MIQKLCVDKKWIPPGLSIEILRYTIPLVIRQIMNTDFVDSSMHIGHERGHTLFDSWRQEVTIGQEALGNIIQSFLGPLMKPVDARAVDNGRELASSHPQCVAHRGKAEDHLQKTTHFIDEVAPDVFARVIDATRLAFVSEQTNYLVNLAVIKQARNFP